MVKKQSDGWDDQVPTGEESDQYDTLQDEDSGYSNAGWGTDSNDDIEDAANRAPSKGFQTVRDDDDLSILPLNTAVHDPHDYSDGLTNRMTSEEQLLLSKEHPAHDEYTPTSRQRWTARSYFVAACTVALLTCLAWTIHHFVLIPSTGAGVRPSSVPTQAPAHDMLHEYISSTSSQLPLQSSADVEAISVKIKEEGSAWPYSAKGHGATATESNGTHAFKPTVLMISLDGFRADYLDRHLTPNLVRVAAAGIQAQYLIPCFPTVTFPNHHSIMTGLYPEAHGIIGNEFWDGEDEFHYTDPKRSWASKWWGGEPLWWTAETQKTLTAMLMWPGTSSKIKGKMPTHWIPYSNSFTLKTKVDQIMNWLDVDDVRTRPQLLSLYIPDIDKAGHAVGPFGKRVDRALRDVDRMIGDLMSRLAARNLTEILHVIILSDHGMSTTEHERLIFLDDVIKMDDIEHLDGWPLWGIRPKATANATAMILALERTAAQSNGSWAVYAQDPGAKIFDPPLPADLITKLTTPTRWHFTNNKRIAPIHAVPEPGYALTSHYEFEVKMDGEYRPKGTSYHSELYETLADLYRRTWL